MRKPIIVFSALSLLVGCNAQKASMPLSGNQAFQPLFAQAQKPPVIVESGKVVAAVTQNRNIQNPVEPDTFFYNVCKQSAKQSSQLAELNFVVTRIQLEALSRACQSNASSINRAWLAGVNSAQ